MAEKEKKDGSPMEFKVMQYKLISHPNFVS